MYEAIATNLEHGNGYSGYRPGPTAYEEPVYPALVGLTYRVFGHSHRAVYVVQVLLALLSGYLVYRIGIILLGSRFLSTLAVGMMAIYLPMIRSTMDVMTEITFATLLALSIFLLLKALGSNNIGKFLICGLVTGATVLCRSITLVMPVALFLMLLLYPRQNKRVVISFIAFCLGMMVVITPWTIRNYLAFHAFVPVVTKSNYVLWEGTYGEGGSVANTGGVPPFVQRFRDRHPTEIQEYRFFGHEVVRNVKSHPLRYIGLAPIKFVRLWLGLLYGVTYKSLYVQAMVHLILLVFAGLSIGVIKNRAPLAFILLVLGVITLGHMATMSSVRFSIPLMPYVFLMALRGFSRFIPEWARAT